MGTPAEWQGFRVDWRFTTEDARIKLKSLYPSIQMDWVLGLIAGLVFGVVRWALWVTVLYVVGGRMLRASGTETSWSELGRVLGFAYSPGVLSIFAFVPFIGGLFALVGFVWTLAAVVVAVRQALDFESTGRAILVVVISAVVGVIPYIVVVWIQAAILGASPGA